MAFTTGQVLTAAQLNNLDINSVTLTANTPYVQWTESDATGGEEYRMYGGETGDLILAGSTDSFVSTTKRLEITTVTGEMALRDGSGNSVVTIGGATRQALLADGSASAPVLAHDGDANCGIYFPAADQVAITTAGTQRFLVTTGLTQFTEEMRGPDGSETAPTYSFTGDTDTGLHYNSASTGCAMAVSGSSITQWRVGWFGPANDNALDCGNASFRWDDVYATNATIQTSDEREKTKDGEAYGLGFLARLEPFRGRWRDKDNGVHQWLSAQQVAAAIAAEGDDPADVAMWHHDPDTDRQSLRYTELIPVLVNAVQELTARVTMLEAERA